MAKCYEILNQFDKSINYYIKLLESSNKDDIPYLHMKLSNLYNKIGDLDKVFLLYILGKLL